LLKHAFGEERVGVTAWSLGLRDRAIGRAYLKAKLRRCTSSFKLAVAAFAPAGIVVSILRSVVSCCLSIGTIAIDAAHFARA
jgi:hypothetical protein